MNRRGSKICTSQSSFRNFPGSGGKCWIAAFGWDCPRQSGCDYHRFRLKPWVCYPIKFRNSVDFTHHLNLTDSRYLRPNAGEVQFGSVRLLVMEQYPSMVNVIGISDSWVFEIVDVLLILGMKPTLVPTPILSRSSPSVVAKDLQFKNFETIDSGSLVFTGSNNYQDLQEEMFPTRVLVPFRELVDLQTRQGLVKWINLIHPMAWVSPTIKLEVDIFVGANCSVGANSSIGSHVRINRNVSIGHDVSIGEGVELGPCTAISSGVNVGSWSFIGAGAVVLNDIQIGEGAIVGAGSVVTRDVPSGAVVFGSPARVQK